MSVMASGTVHMKMKQPVPEKIVKLVQEEIHLTFNELEYVAEFDGNWRLDDVIDALELLNPYIKSGDISYWSDEGEARAEFKNVMWIEEWQEHYYPSELPTYDLSFTERVAEILDTAAKGMTKKGKASLLKLLTDDELKLYKLTWLKD